MNQASQQYQLGKWTYIPATRQLADGKEEYLIEMRLNKLLAFLITRKNEIVPRTIILDEVWAGTVVSEENLTKGIADLRKLLNDLQGHHLSLETIHKVGYRLREDETRRKAKVGRVIVKVVLYLLGTIIFLIILIRAINY